MKKQILLLFIFQLVYLVGKTQDPIFDWSRAMGGTGEEYGYSVTTDPAGNVYTVGTFSGTADFDPGPGVSNATSNGQNDLYIQKMDKNGFLLWIKTIGGTGNEYAYKVKYDASSGNIYIAGGFETTVDFDPGTGTTTITANGITDGYVLCLTTSGNYVNAYTMGGSGNIAVCTSLTFDASGRIHTTGRFTGTVDFNPSGGVLNLTSAGGFDVFVQKLSS
ncbi:MAG TPA: hypothetical protein VD905_16000, partial [Flavobacteriales bacterium]|nr:hypothetical protein [Flavobacteriales bacterium]